MTTNLSRFIDKLIEDVESCRTAGELREVVGKNAWALSLESEVNRPLIEAVKEKEKCF